MFVLARPMTINGIAFEAGTPASDIVAQTPCDDAWCKEAAARGLLLTEAHVQDAEPDDESAPRAPARAAIKLAEQNDIDLSDVTGTGRGGQIVKADVQRVIAQRAATDEARALAAEHNLNIDDIAGTGPDGQVVLPDVKAVLSSES